MVCAVRHADCLEAFFIPYIMKNIELFNEQDLESFQKKAGYFLSDHLTDANLPEHGFSYDNIPNQVKFSEFISKIDLKNELVEALEDDIIQCNDRIVDCLKTIKGLQKNILIKSEALEDIKPLKSFKSIFKQLIRKG